MSVMRQLKQEIQLLQQRLSEMDLNLKSLKDDKKKLQKSNSKQRSLNKELTEAKAEVKEQLEKYEKLNANRILKLIDDDDLPVKELGMAIQRREELMGPIFKMVIKYMHTEHVDLYMDGCTLFFICDIICRVTNAICKTCEKENMKYSTMVR